MVTGSAFTVRVQPFISIVPTYRYSTSAVPVYYSLRPMVTGTPVYPLMICYSVFDVCSRRPRPTSSTSLVTLHFLPTASLNSPLLSGGMGCVAGSFAPAIIISSVLSAQADVLRRAISARRYSRATQVTTRRLSTSIPALLDHFCCRVALRHRKEYDIVGKLIEVHSSILTDSP